MMGGRNGSRPAFDEDEAPTEQPLIRQLRGHGERLDDQAEEQGRIMAAVSRLEVRAERTEAKVDALARRIPKRLTVRQGAQVLGVSVLVILEVLRAAGVPLPQVGQPQPAAERHGGR
jgi:hypothetical protein